MRSLLLVLLLASCGSHVTGGDITGKYIEHHHMANGRGEYEDKACYYLSIMKDAQSGAIEVTEKAWEQALVGMKWPFEVK